MTCDSTHLTPPPQGGVVLLLCGLCLSVVQRSVGKKLAVDLGGEIGGGWWWSSLLFIFMYLLPLRCQEAPGSLHAGGCRVPDALGCCSASYSRGALTPSPLSHSSSILPPFLLSLSTDQPPLAPHPPLSASHKSGHGSRLLHSLHCRSPSSPALRSSG